MGKIERYEIIIKAALEIHQLRIELERKLAEISKNITAQELSSRCFDDKAAKKVFSILSHDIFEIKECKYVKSEAIYKDVRISLHSCHDKLGASAMRQILDNIKSSEIFDA